MRMIGRIAWIIGATVIATATLIVKVASLLIVGTYHMVRK